jgi:hypothetical protein
MPSAPCPEGCINKNGKRSTHAPKNCPKRRELNASNAVIDPGMLNLMIAAENVALAIGNSGVPFAPLEGLEEDLERLLAGGNILLSLN